VPPIVADAWAGSTAYLRGVSLFNAGYYWEAHEAWEALWHAHGRRGASAAVLKGLIKLAAAGVKVRERQPHGVAIHARRAAALFQEARATGGNRQFGLDLSQWIDQAEQIADHPPGDPEPPGAPVSRVFSFRIEPE
jgi:predicted metal-dependent hydrolase